MKAMTGHETLMKQHNRILLKGAYFPFVYTDNTLKMRTVLLRFEIDLF